MIRPVVAGEWKRETTAGEREMVLRTKGLSKTFGSISAVKDLNLELYRGEVFGFLGPNGAGKSTTVGMILGLLQPTLGSIELFGQPLTTNKAKLLRRVGAIVETPAFYPYLSGWDNLRVVAGASGGITDAKIGQVLEQVDLYARSKDKLGTYSLGMRQRLGIASTLLKDPDLIILDEPTNGLDPAGTKEVREMIPNLASTGQAVFLCSHLLHEVELVCQRVAIIKDGSMLACGPIGELLQRGHVLQVRAEPLEQAATILGSQPWVSSVKVQDNVLLVEAPPERARDVNVALASQGIYLTELRPRSVSLENFFLEVTGEESDDKTDRS